MNCLCLINSDDTILYTTLHRWHCTVCTTLLFYIILRYYSNTQILSMISPIYMLYISLLVSLSTVVCFMKSSLYMCTLFLGIFMSQLWLGLMPAIHLNGKHFSIKGPCFIIANAVGTRQSINVKIVLVIKLLSINCWLVCIILDIHWTSNIDIQLT
jgi:hypothetical protein